MKHRVAILGASLGGMVAASELRRQGFEVTIFEKGAAVGGLYSKAETPFGTQELGMHVLYAARHHYEHLCDIFGEESFHVMHGARVDIGASANFGGVYWGSHYPSLLGHPLQSRVLDELIAHPTVVKPSFNAEDEAIRRFGPTAARAIVVPILRKLWGLEPSALSAHALHCFFDLRRIVVAKKADADRLKDNKALDDVVANPDQGHPKGEVFGGRMGLLFRDGERDLSKCAAEWARRVGINLQLNADVAVVDNELSVNGAVLARDFDACLVAVPVHMLAREHLHNADKVELTIYYLRLEAPLGDHFPSYYVLAHDSAFQASRIVNYDSYRPNNTYARGSVIAVEAIHARGNAPTCEAIAAEVLQIQPHARVSETFQMPRSLPVLAPSLANGRLLDAFEASIARKFGKPMFFTGMRTDTGIFFSHHTIGLAYDSALACIGRLP
jgi:protoporphyrinogen oxidase